MRIDSDVIRGTILAAAIAYAGAVVLARWLPALAVAAAAVIALVALGFGWHRSGQPRTPVFAAALGMPLHLILLATGGLASPLLPLIAPWLVLVGALDTLPRTAALSGAATILLLSGEAWTQDLGLLEPLAVGTAVFSGLLPAWLLDRARVRARVNEGVLNRIREEAGAGRAGDGRVEASRRVDELGRMLDGVRQRLGARRAVIWDVHVASDRARPRIVSGGDPPPPIPLSGDPLRWAWEEALPLRLETPPRWAAGYARACVVPIEPMGERAAILTLEYEVDIGFPTAQALDENVARIRTFLQMQEQQAQAVAIRERYGILFDLLRRLPMESEVKGVARELAAYAMRLADASGAAVALWEKEVGSVLAVVGDDGGPQVDMVFGLQESEMALAARGVATLIRERGRGDGAALPVAAPGERWFAEPRALVVVPLQGTGIGVVGVLAVWSADASSLDPDVVETLETLAPYVARQLYQTRAMGELKEYADRDALTGLRNRRSFEQELARATAGYQRNRRPVSLVLLDVDHFKSINDTLGHDAGDAVLRSLGALLQASVREIDVPARLGGEEFVILLPDTGLAAAVDVAERIRQQVEATTVEWRGKQIPVRISAGVSSCPERVPTPQALVKTADAALYDAKNDGRNRVNVAPLGSIDQDGGFV